MPREPRIYPITRWHCPYEGCPWTCDDEFIVDWAIIEQVIEDHLNDEHPGWTVAELEELKLGRENPTV